MKSADGAVGKEHDLMQGKTAITIEAIESKDFRIKAHGYDQEEVDTFLDDICDEMERQQGVIADLRKQLDEARAEQARPSEPVKAVGSDDIREMLEITQRIKHETLTEARKKAEQIVAEAQTKAKAQLGDLSGTRDRLTREIEDLKKTAADYRAKFAALIDAQKKLLDNSDI